jgi:hypothetical protein
MKITLGVRHRLSKAGLALAIAAHVMTLQMRISDSADIGAYIALYVLVVAGSLLYIFA